VSLAVIVQSPRKGFTAAAMEGREEIVLKHLTDFLSS
jgi:hypothetical protein